MTTVSSRELFYQLGLRQFGAYGCEILEPPLSIRELLKIAVDAEEGLLEAGCSPGKIIEVRGKATKRKTFGLMFTNVLLPQSTVTLLMDRREMLEEYFSLRIDDECRLVSLPTLLPGYSPPIEHLPFFMLCLGQRACPNRFAWSGRPMS